jgi:hypothetical protein
MKTLRPTRLRFARETLRALSDGELGLAAGGTQVVSSCITGPGGCPKPVPPPPRFSDPRLCDPVPPRPSLPCPL